MQDIVKAIEGTNVPLANKVNVALQLAGPIGGLLSVLAQVSSGLVVLGIKKA